MFVGHLPSAQSGSYGKLRDEWSVFSAEVTESAKEAWEQRTENLTKAECQTWHTVFSQQPCKLVL